MTRSGPTDTTLPAARADVRWLVAGETVCREGDAPGPMYLVCAGSVRVYRNDPAAPDSPIELARLGPGSVIGEIAPILNQPRNATVEAAEDTQILELPMHKLGTLTKRQAPLLRVVAYALRERAGLDPDQLVELAARVGIDLSAEPLELDQPVVRPRKLPAPEHDRAAIYPKEVICPACGTTFSALVFRTHKEQPSGRATDFHQSYRTPNKPYDYEIWVCPNDLYAALAADFTTLTPTQGAAVDATVEQVVANELGGVRPDFNVDRTLTLRDQALRLALAQYRMRDASPLRLAALLHRLAWCARERGDDAATEQQFLTLALAEYRRGYDATDGSNPQEELRLQYLCGELCLRLGDVSGALTWFAQALRHTDLKKYPKWDRMLRDQWVVARGAKSTTLSQTEMLPD
jgi:uncharacterized protein (DUF2225 family)